MKSLALCLSLAVAAALAPPPSAATVLTFDDLGDRFVPTNYGGLDWSAGDWFAFGEPQDPYAAHSGAYRAVSGFGDADAATSIAFRIPGFFQGAWFSGLDGATVTFLMYRDGALVATSSTLDPGATPQFLSSGYGGTVDRIVVASPGQGSFAMDDFSFTAVPEPGTLALVLAGAGVCGVAGRRRRAAASAANARQPLATPLRPTDRHLIRSAA